MKSIATFLFMLLTALPSARAASECASVFDPASTLAGHEAPHGPAVMARRPYRSGTRISALDTRRLSATANPEYQGRQRQDMWCWAASCQMVLNYHGFGIPQETLVHRTKGYVVNQPGSTYEAMDALSGWWVRSLRDGLVYTTAAEQMRIDFRTIYDEITSRQSPMLVAMRGDGRVGHMVIVTGVTYDVDLSSRRYIPRTVVIRDPWPGSPSRQEIGWDEFISRANSLTRISFFVSH